MGIGKGKKWAMNLSDNFVPQTFTHTSVKNCPVMNHSSVDSHMRVVINDLTLPPAQENKTRT